MFSDFFASMSFWEIILIILGAFIVGYLIRYFSGPKAVPEKSSPKPVASATPEVNEWEVKYKSFQANYDQNKQEWQQKNKSNEDRAKTYQAQLTEIKALYEQAGVEKAEAASKLRLMETQRNEVLDNAKKITAELLGASENIKAQQEKINTLSSALSMASNIKREVPKPIIISDEELTKKYETETAALKKQLEEKDKKVIALLSKEAAANELQLRNDKLASENRVFRNEMAAANLDAETAIEKAQQLKDLQLQVLSLSNKVALANGETANAKKQLAEQQKRNSQQAGKVNELRTIIGQERNNAKAKIEALENELAPFKPKPEVVAIPEAEQVVEEVAPILETEKTAPVVEQIVTSSPEIDITQVVVDAPAQVAQEILPEAKEEAKIFAPEPTTEALVSPAVIEPTTTTTTEIITEKFPVDVAQNTTNEATTFPLDHNITLPETGRNTIEDKNNLLLIQGITTEIKALLENEGINDLDKLAKATPDDLKTILANKDGSDFANVNPKSWPIQAQLLADGKLDAFASYTKYLIDGVDPSEVQS